MFRRNWRDAGAYRELLGPGMDEWIAWEFVTRNPEYIQDVALYERDIAAWINAQKDTSELAKILQYEDFYALLAVEREDSSQFYYMQIWESHADHMGLNRGPEGWYCKSEKWLNHFRNRWHLHRIIMCNFIDDHGKEHSDFRGDEFRCFSNTAENESDTYKQLGQRIFSERLQVLSPRVLVPVDLSLPIEELERTAIGLIRYLRKKGMEQGSVKVRTSRLLNRGVYVEHLRILDGVAAGATIAEIGEVLHPGAINGPEDKQRDKRIRAAHKAALKMRDEGWRVLAGVPD